MIITCPECTTNFVVDTSALGTQGRKVRCSLCKNVWFQTPPQEESNTSHVTPIPENLIPIPQGSGLPVICNTEKKSPFKTFFGLAVLACILLTLIIPPSRLLHQPDMTGLAIYDTTIEKHTIKQRNVLLVNGTIANESPLDKPAPDIHLTFLDKNGKSLGNTTLALKNIPIESGNELPFEDIVTQYPQNTASITIDIGNNLQLAIRSQHSFLSY